MSEVKLGLALGAGGAKGLAHIGFIEVLEENNIKIDCISGSSMGAFIGSIYAACGDFNYIKNQLDTFKQSNVIDFDIFFLRRLSITRGKKIQTLMKEILGENRTFEECKIPYCCTAVDLLTGNAVVLKTGVLWKAVYSSCCVPSAFPPMEYDNMLLVDGGVLDRIPTHQCYELGANIVIGVDVVGKPPLLTEESRPKNIVDVLIRSFDIMDYNLTTIRANSGNLMITIQQDEVESLAVKNLRMSYDQGRKTACENIDKIKELIEKKKAE